MIRVSREDGEDVRESATDRSVLLRTMLEISEGEGVDLVPPPSISIKACRDALRGLETLEFPDDGETMRCLDWLGALEDDDVLDAAVRAMRQSRRTWDFSSDADGIVPDVILSRLDSLPTCLYPIDRFGDLSLDAQRLVIRHNAKVLSDMFCSVRVQSILKLMMIDSKAAAADVVREEQINRAQCAAWIVPPVLVVHRLASVGCLDDEAYDSIVTRRLGRFSALDFAIMDTFTPLARRIHPELVAFGKTIEHRAEESVGEFMKWTTIKRSPRVSNPRFNACEGYGTFDASKESALLDVYCREAYVFCPDGSVSIEIPEAYTRFPFPQGSYVLAIYRLPLN